MNATLDSEPAQRLPSAGALPTQLLSIVDALSSEAHSGRHGRAGLDSSLERDLELDSLARAELLLRIEHEFGVRLPEGTLAQMETPRDLLRALERAGTRPALATSAELAPAAAPEDVGAAPDAACTLIEVLDWHVARHPERAHIHFYRHFDQLETHSYADLQRGARGIAAGLTQRHLQPGQSVAIMLPTGLEFFHAFYGILLAGGVPVPLYPPARPSQIEDHLRRQASILNSCQAPILITLAEAKLVAQLVRAQVDTLHSVLTIEELQGADGVSDYRPRTNDIALLQYTSGSTGNPKGVVLTHANLLANIRAWSQAIELSSSDVCVSWLPLYHDMGLIGAWLGSLYNACPLVLMSPLAFLARPAAWLWAIHRHRGTITAAPNFAFELCLRRIDDAELAGLDLSSWRLAANGAEPVSPDTLERFITRFAAYGFRRETMAPVYGLAECAVGLAVPPLGRVPRIDRVQRAALSETGRALPAAPNAPQALRFAGCGVALPGHEMRIVDDAGRELPERHVGCLQFRGPSATRGYFRNPEATQRLLRGDWLDSGDIAYLADGEVFLTSRAKDMIIRGGHNLYPYELEEAISQLDGVRKGCVAVFGAFDPAAATERLVAVIETRTVPPEAQEVLRQRITALAVDLLGSPLDDIVLAAPQSVLKTSSGKIRRAATRDAYLAGRLGKRASAPWLQMAHLAIAGGAGEVRRSVRYLAEILYASYVYLLFALIAPVVWLLIAASPRPAWNWALGGGAARLFVRLAGIPLTIHGVENLPRDGSCVVVANHASYIDGIVLMAVLKHPVAFVAKRELGEQFLAGSFLRGIGCSFVERFDVQRSVDDAGRLRDSARNGGSLAFFPEGTFTHAPGLRQFHMGAFLAAAEAGLPVVPVTIEGARQILRDQSRMPRHGTLRVTIGVAIAPQGANWAAALALRNAARTQILHHCGEPDLAR